MPTFRTALSSGVAGRSGGGTAMGLYNNALAANRAELASLLDMSRAREAKVMGDLDAYGRNQLQDLSDSHLQNLAGSEQAAISRGLGNNTIRASMAGGVRMQTQRSMDRINNDIALRRAETYGRLSGDTMNILQRGMTPYPSYGEYAGADRADRALDLQAANIGSGGGGGGSYRTGGGGGGGSGGGGGGGRASQGGSFADWARGTYLAPPTNQYNYNAFSGGGYGVAPARGGWPGGYGVNPNQPNDGSDLPAGESPEWLGQAGGFGDEDYGGLGGYGSYG